MKIVQFSRPFLHSTSNWRSSGCDLDISHVITGDEVLYGSEIASALPVNKTGENKEIFSYVFKEDMKNTLDAKFQIPGKSRSAILFASNEIE